MTSRSAQPISSRGESTSNLARVESLGTQVAVGRGFGATRYGCWDQIAKRDSYSEREWPISINMPGLIGCAPFQLSGSHCVSYLLNPELQANKLVLIIPNIKQIINKWVQLKLCASYDDTKHTSFVSQTATNHPYSTSISLFQ